MAYRRRTSLVNYFPIGLLLFLFSTQLYLPRSMNTTTTSKKYRRAWSPASQSQFAGMAIQPISICRHAGYSRQSCTHDCMYNLIFESKKDKKGRNIYILSMKVSGVYLFFVLVFALSPSALVLYMTENIVAFREKKGIQQSRVNLLTSHEFANTSNTFTLVYPMIIRCFQSLLYETINK